MVGDVNMFLPNGKDEEGECEIMIAGVYPVCDRAQQVLTRPNRKGRQTQRLCARSLVSLVSLVSSVAAQ